VEVIPRESGWTVFLFDPFLQWFVDGLFKMKTMKKLVNILVFAVMMAGMLSCGSKSEKNEATDSDNVVKTSMPTAKERETQLRKEKAERTERAKRENTARIPTTYKDSKGKIVYNKAEVGPAFNGGEEALIKYLNEHIEYPAEAKKKGLEGTVYVNFVVAEDGGVREAVVDNDISDAVDQSLRDEAIRLVKSMPKWVPGRQRGKPVDVKFSLPITFKLL
jgi:TonB family protein